MDKATRLMINELIEQLETNSDALEMAIEIAEEKDLLLIKFFQRIIEHNDSKRTRALELLG